MGTNMQNLTKITLNHAKIVDFAAARNEELAKAKADWVLFVDTDEVVTPALEKEISEAIKSKKYDAYYIPRLDTFLGRELRHGETGGAKFIRLARRNYGKWERPVHEQWVGRGRLSSARVGTLTNPLLHNPHPTIASFLDKINRYSTIDAQYRFKEGQKSSLLHIWFFPIAKFKYNFLWRLGFLDGVPGTIMAIMMSFHSYLTWTKLYLLWHKK